MKASVCLFFAIPLCAQAPSEFDEAFFKGDIKVIAASCADRARRIKPKDSRLLADCGHSYLAAGDRPKAEATFQSAMASDPKDGETYRRIVLAWLKSGFKAEAMEAVERMKQMDPKNHNVFTKCACDLLHAGSIAEAGALMDHAASIEPGDSGNCFDFADAAIKANQKELAIKWYSKVDPKDKNDLAKSARQILELGDATLAESLLEKAYRLDPKDWFNIADFGEVAVRQGKTELAAKWFAKAVLATPNDQRMWDRIAEIYADTATVH